MDTSVVISLNTTKKFRILIHNVSRILYLAYLVKKMHATQRWQKIKFTFTFITFVSMWISNEDCTTNKMLVDEVKCEQLIVDELVS